jgi:large subunit ribosomal protein L3
MMGILGKKIGMTQLYTAEDKLTPVTLIEAGPCTVLQIKVQAKDKYTALKLGYDDKKQSRANKAALGNFKKAKSSPKRFVKEIRLKSAEGYTLGQQIRVDIFKEGEFVDITGVSKGKGFQGGMKRWNWTAGKGGHGSMHHRRVGSIGASASPSRVLKGQHMPGHMGADKTTIQNLEILKVDTDKNLLAVKGTVPGHNNAYLTVRPAKKVRNESGEESKK